MAAPSAASAATASAPLTEALAASARRYFFRVAAAMSLAGAPLTLLLPPGRADPRWFVAVFAALGVAAALALRLPAERQSPALTAFLAADSVALAAVALFWPGGFGEAAMALFGILACVSFAGSGRRAGLAVAALQVLLLLAVHAALWPTEAQVQAAPGTPGAHLARLALHLLNVAVGTAAGLLIARALVLPMRLAAEREAALLATQSLYRDLFTLSPVALLVHRAGIAIDANPAALALYGVASVDELRRFNLYDFFEDGDHRERAYARRDTINAMPVGAVLPMADFRLAVGTRSLSVRITGVRIEVEGEPAVLAIIADDTERLAAEAAVRRSGAMLSHVVATTPDLVAVTEVASGRFTMVNPAFERDLGWTAAEAIGHTTMELRTWWSDKDRPAFIAALEENGRVYNRPAAFRTRAGRRLEVSVSAARFALAGSEYIVLSARDLTGIERLRLEREAILANASVGIAVTRQRRFVLANRHFEQMFGWGEGELLGHEGRVVWPDQAAYRGVGRRHGAALARGERVEFEAVMARRGGSTLLAQVRAHAIDPKQPQDGGTVWIVEDITERREAERALHEARSAAEAASRAKSAFLANTSHELRTPLNGIVGLAALARNAALDDAQRQRYLEQIVDSARSLTALISDILDLSKIEAGRMELERVPFDLGELLRTLQQTYAPLAAARGLALRFEVDGSVGTGAVGDPLRLRQVIGNFLSNALKFTAQGGIVVRAQRLPPNGENEARGTAEAGHAGEAAGAQEATAAAAGERLRFEVQDSGVGIEPAARARLFQPFTQADQSTTRRFGGTGLGLSISRELATLMGGEVGVTSEPGRGSCFWLELPLPRTTLPEPAAPAPSDGALQGMRVLMVEDNPVNMLIAVAMLEGWGVEVEQAADGVQALALLKRALATGRAPDAVLMDLQMPLMSGYEATQALRALPGTERLPVIALTAAAMVDERERASAAGMDDFLTKPIDPERLRATLAHWRQAGAKQGLPAGEPRG